MSKKEEKKNSKESVDDVKMTEKDADAAKTAGAEDDGTQAQKENTDAENPKGLLSNLFYHHLFSIPILYFHR